MREINPICLCHLLFLRILDAFRSSAIPAEPNTYLYLPQKSQKSPPGARNTSH